MKAVTPAVCRSRDGSGVFSNYYSLPVGQRQPFEHGVLVDRITEERLRSYLQATAGNAEAAIRFYDWNVRVSGALLEDVARLEVVFRNSVDASLVEYRQRTGQPTEWYRDRSVFSRKGNDLIDTARRRATKWGLPERHGKVIAELAFGFWTFLCTRRYLTSLWVPAVVAAFPHHPHAPDPRTVRFDVHDRMQRIHLLRNRIAHHEPIHRRDLSGDVDALVELVGWICADARAWIIARSRTNDVLRQRP